MRPTSAPPAGTAASRWPSSTRPTARAWRSGRSPRRPTGGWLAPGAIAVIEERKGTGVALPAGFEALDQRTWGDTQALFARFTGGQG